MLVDSISNPISEEEWRRRRDVYLSRTYGISLEEFEEILDRQDGGCAGCGALGKTRSLHVDHDHKTGIIRGILCATCNSALRKIRDNADIGRNLAAYLEDPPAVAVLAREQVILRPKKRKRRRR